MDISLADFLRQMPIGLLAAPVFFGVVYVVLMVIIFRRARQRRRQRAATRAQAIASMTAAPATTGTIGLPSSADLAWHQLPEPDLGLLIAPAPLPVPVRTPALPERIPETSAALIAPEPAQNALETTPQADWPVMMPNIPPLPDTLPDPDNADHDDMVEVMRIWRDLGDGRLIIELGGRRYRSVSEIANGELLRRFSSVVRELGQMIAGSPASQPTALPTGVSVDPGLTSSAAGSGTLSEPLSGNLRNRIGILNASADNSEAEAAKSRGILRSVVRQATIGSLPVKQPGIGDAVEDFLQFKLSNTSQYQMRSIHIRPASDGAIRIEVDGHFYDGVGDVADADVRNFLAATLREWEARQ